MKSNLLAPLGAAAVSLVCFISSPAMAGESGVQGSIQANSVPTDQPWTQPARAAFTIDTKGPDSFAVDIAGKVYFPLGTSPSVFGLGELVLHRNSQQKKEQISFRHQVAFITSGIISNRRKAGESFGRSMRTPSSLIPGSPSILTRRSRFASLRPLPFYAMSNMWRVCARPWTCHRTMGCSRPTSANIERTWPLTDLSSRPGYIIWALSRRPFITRYSKTQSIRTPAVALPAACPALR